MKTVTPSSDARDIFVQSLWRWRSPSQGIVNLGGKESFYTKWFFSLAAQQSSKESFRGALITARVNQDVDHVAILIHGTPRRLLLAVDSNEDFVPVPNIAEAALTPLQFSGIFRSDF